MFTRVRRAYRALRYLPRHIVTVLDAAAADIRTIRLRQDAQDARADDAWRQANAELRAFRDEAEQQWLALGKALDSLAAWAPLLENLPASSADILAELRSARTEMTRIAATPASGDGATQAGIAALTGLVRQQIAGTEHLAAVVAEHARIYPSWIWTPESAEQILAVLGLLCPAGVQNVARTRLGRDRDGGYVMLDDFAGIGAALSLGIADDVSWDADIAARGIRVFQFDPSVAGPPEPNDLFVFEPLRVAPQDGSQAVSLDGIVQGRLAAEARPLLLKIDIEGDEWDVFMAASDATLLRFRQIICEFHDLQRLAEADFRSRAEAVFGRLARWHFVYHVHGNNCGSFVNVGNVVIPQTLEVCYGLRSRYTMTDAVSVFPTALDRPNQPGRADLYLGSFRFGADATLGYVTLE